MSYAKQPDNQRTRKAPMAYGTSRHCDTRRRYKLQYLYGLTPEQHADMVVAQAGICPLCLRTPKRLVVDHDHITGRVRALLCDGCNGALGAVEKHAGWLARVSAYLEHYRVA